MGHYSDDSSSVRVDFFKSSGKWYTTEAVKWIGKFETHTLVNEEFTESVWEHLKSTTSQKEFNKGRVRLLDMVAVCIDLYHPHSFPLMMQVEDMLRTVMTRDVRVKAYSDEADRVKGLAC